MPSVKIQAPKRSTVATSIGTVTLSRITLDFDRDEVTAQFTVSVTGVKQAVPVAHRMSSSELQGRDAKSLAAIAAALIASAQAAGVIPAGTVSA